ncbi:MAG TPA: hypothetical protein VN230_05075 [Burkholderiaceae bacterium]|nr:hypothetical protein [Burkholderiaceae bacterium]
MKRVEPLRDETCTRAQAATAALLAQRRRLLTAAALGPAWLATAVATTLAPRGAHAAAGLPAAVRELDAAAMALFDAAEASRWPQAQHALSLARRAATATRTLEGAYTEAGGAVHRFYQARNDLSGDLIEAGTAISVKDRRWLINVAERIVARAGEMALPFAERADALNPQIETLLYLARRMRRALVWNDPFGYQGAHQDFSALWKGLRADPATGLSAGRIQSLEQALQRAGQSRSVDDARRLYEAVQSLHQAGEPGSRPL